MLKAGFSIWAEMLSELVVHRELIWRLIVRDISAKFKQSAFGILWAFLNPLAMLIILIWLKKKFLDVGNTTMPYPAFLFLGQTVWLFFSSGLNNSANSLISAGSMLKKINFPREVLVISSIGQTVFEFLIRIPLLIIIFLWVDFIPKWTIVLIPLTMIPLFLMILGIGLLVSLLNAVMRDTGSAIGIIISLGMFATPVIYPPPSTWPLSLWINHINPVSGIIIAVRDLASLGYLSNPAAYITSTLFGLTVFLIGWRAFHITEPKIAEGI